MPKPIPTPAWQQESIKVYQGDCIKIMLAMPMNSVDLLFADPPFNIGHKYDIYEDKLSKQKYLEWTRDWLIACRHVLKPTGSIYVAIGAPLQAEVKVLMDQVGFHWRDTICWYYTFGPRQTSKLTPSWVAIHYATMNSKQWVWNAYAIKVPSARQLKYNDKRAVAGGKLPDNVWMLLPDEQKYGAGGNGVLEPWQNTWLESRVCGTFKERTNHPAQMPLPVLERIVLMSSNPGDMVLDPFAGSGTTLVAARRHGRRTTGIELSEGYVNDVIIPRLESEPCHDPSR